MDIAKVFIVGSGLMGSEIAQVCVQRGLDVIFGVLMAMYKETGDPRWFPPMILRRKVKSGELGRKTGKGWYEYDEQGRRKSRWT
jgi:3-hydroxyacyl-CoA dehydrogenase